MAEQRRREGGGSRPAMPPPQRASGTLRGSALRSRSRKPAFPGWVLVACGLLIALLGVAWILGNESPPDGATGPGAANSQLAAAVVTAPATVTATPVPRSLPIVSPTPTEPSPSQPRPSPTPSPIRATPTSAPPTVAPTARPTLPPPSHGPGFGILFPGDHELLQDDRISVFGTGPPGATVTRDIPLWFDDHVTVRADGTWQMRVSLGLGENVFRFRVGDDRSTERVITVTYEAAF